MKFIFDGDEMVLASAALPGPKDAWELFGEAVKGGAGWSIDKFFEFVGEGIVVLWDAFVLALPDIMGYSTILAGICIIIGSMIGKGGLMKPISVYGAFMILALCILGGS